jgi:uncharacterized BrkB/YihY/UPF0761 family membrane protein
MEAFGLIIGLALLVVVSVTAWLLGAKANAGVREFREEHHENFLGRKRS